MPARRIILSTPVYGALIAGSLLFALPFAWMLSTSFKTDRELYSQTLNLVPQTPLPRAQSPYVDDRYYADLDGSPHLLARMLPRLERQIQQIGFDLGATPHAAEAQRQIARGLYRRLLRRSSAEALAAGDAEVDRLIASEIDRPMVEDTWRTIRRTLGLGPIRVTSRQLVEQELSAARPLSQRFDNRSPDLATLTDLTADTGRPFALVSYDFARGDAIVLSGTFDLDFDAADLHRVILDVLPDDTWHDLTLTVERNGRLFRSRTAIPLANFDWMTLTWQEPSDDDESTKIKTWTLIEDASPSDVTAPHQVRLTLTVHRVGQLQAWANKLSLNYKRTLNYLPLGRYLRVSLFLVLTNIVLTVFASSLVAYSFARLTWPGRDFCFLLMLATMMIPGQVMMIPHFLIWRSVGAYNTLTPLWLGHSFGSAFFIFLLRQFLLGIPRNLEDAAKIDGCGFWRIYWHVMLPLIKPSLAAIAIFTFMGTWNDFMGPLLYLADQRLYSLAFGLYAFAVQVGNNPALTMAGSVIMTLPVILLFFFAQRYFIQGVTLTGIKA